MGRSRTTTEVVLSLIAVWYVPVEPILVEVGW